MKIGGFEKQSFIDWEGKLAAVIFTAGCNFRCGYCHNPELVYPRLIRQSKFIPEQEVFDYLSTRKQWLDGVVITGGEPTMHHDLPDFIKTIKQMGYRIKLDTNGSNPKLLQKLIENQWIDYVAMDIKTVLSTKPYQEICGVTNKNSVPNIEKCLEILQNSNIDYQLRTTVIPKYHTTKMIADLQQQFNNCDYRLQPYRATRIG